MNAHDFMFCSGGEDLCLWDIKGKLLCKEAQPSSDCKFCGHFIFLLHTVSCSAMSGLIPNDRHTYDILV